MHNAAEYTCICLYLHILHPGIYILLGLKDVTLQFPRIFQQNREGGGTFQHIELKAPPVPGFD